MSEQTEARSLVDLRENETLLGGIKNELAQPNAYTESDAPAENAGEKRSVPGKREIPGPVQSVTIESQAVMRGINHELAAPNEYI